MILMLVIRLFLVGRFTALIVWTRKARGRRRGGIGVVYRSRHQHHTAVRQR